jgi:hypothetical protein
MKTITIKFLTSFFIFSLLTSCCTLFHGVTQMVDISSQPSGAKIYIDGREYGSTPLSIPLNRQGRLVGESKSKKEYLVKIVLDGYLPYEIKLNRKFNKLALLETTWLILDASNGAVYTLTPDQVSAKMGKKSALNNSKNDNLNIAVTLNPDPSWERIGTLAKANN